MWQHVQINDDDADFRYLWQTVQSWHHPGKKRSFWDFRPLHVFPKEPIRVLGIIPCSGLVNLFFCWQNQHFAWLLPPKLNNPKRLALEDSSIRKNTTFLGFYGKKNDIFGFRLKFGGCLHSTFLVPIAIHGVVLAPATGPRGSASARPGPRDPQTAVRKRQNNRGWAPKQTLEMSNQNHNNTDTTTHNNDILVNT